MKYNKKNIMKKAWELYNMSKKWVASCQKSFASCLRDALGEYGTICLYSGCDDLIFTGQEIAINYNARHEADRISPMYTGYAPFEI